MRFLDRVRGLPSRSQERFPSEAAASAGRRDAAGTPAEAPQIETFRFRGFEIPINLMLLTGGGPDTFEAISDIHMRNLDREHGLRPGLRILELGCGIGRDAIPLAEIIGPSGSYLGIDIIRESIDWCARNISLKYPNVTFHYDDVKDSLHNPAGTVGYESVRLPVDDGTIDLVIAQSVFTHMLGPELTHYLKEFARVLARNGTIYATCFRITLPILESARRTNLTPWDLRFEHDMGQGCYVNELEHMTGAVGYTEAALTDMIAEAGLELRREIRPGGWSGFFKDAPDGQDALVLQHAE
jgi:SAM-dependent methyltransferase